MVEVPVEVGRLVYLNGLERQSRVKWLVVVEADDFADVGRCRIDRGHRMLVKHPDGFVASLGQVSQIKDQVYKSLGMVGQWIPPTVAQAHSGARNSARILML
ncbi:hypothetical protein KCU88_g266, partial [Aureobasidium melanogenum]